MSKKVESSRRRRKAQTTLETYFLLAAEKGDVQLMEETMELLKVDGSAEDLNFMNKHDKTALQLAIEYGHKAIIDLLLQHNVDIGDCLLYAVDNDYLDAVETLLGDAVDKKQDLDERGFPKIVNKPVERDNEDFQNDMCPMVLAAHRNHYEIIQTLLKYGAHDIILNEREFQSDDIEWQTEKHTVERSLGLLNFYKAISSPAYIAITELNKSTNSDKSGDKKDIQDDYSADKDVDKTDKASFEDGVIDPQNVCDPFGKAFELSSTLKEMSETEYEFSKDYLELSEQCEDFAADLLGQTRHTKDELHTVLAHDSQWKTEDIISGDRPSKVIYAVEKEQKKFVAHPHCQQELITRWYGNGSLQHWRDKTTSRNVVISMTIMLFFPILSLLYYFVPFGKVKRFMRTPYVKFLMHTASYVFFLILLLMSTVDFSTLGIGNYVHRLIIQQLENQQRGPPFSVLEKLIFIWILAMTWREIKELWNEGLSSYINDPWNWIDWVQLLLYWCWVAFRVWAIVEVALERNEQDLNETIPATAYSSHMESHLVTKIQRFNNSDDSVMLAYNDSDNQTENSNITYLDYEAELFLNSTTSPTNDTTNTSTIGHMTTEYQSTEPESTQFRTTIHTTPKHTTRHETTFYTTAPEHTTPNETMLNTTTPEHTTLHEPTFHTTTPEHTPPHRTTIHTTTPKHTTQHETTFYTTAPEHTTPNETMLNMTTPEHTTPHRTTFHTTTPKHTTPNEATNHTTTAKHTTSHRTTIHTTPKPSTRHRTTIHKTPHDTTTPTTVTPRRATPPSYPLSPVVKVILDHVSDEHVNTRIHAKVLAYNVTGMVLGNISQIIQEIEFPSECEESLANVSQAIDDLASEIYYWLPTERPTIPDDVEPTDSEYDDISYSSPRSEWDSLEPTLLADCVLACATVISVIRFLRVMVINEQVGPMQISFSKMITDVILFLVMFSVLWIAFALGMTQIYWSYAADEEITCLREGGSQSDCSNQPYGTLLNSMATLFWSLFGLVELDTLEVEPDHSSTEFFGELLYALFQLTAVIILLNLLIAFMGTTYDNVSENSDVEWKFYRSQMWMAFFRRGATLPPPFNIIPSPKSIVRFCCFIYYNVLCRKRGQMRKKKQTAKIIAKHEDYMKVCKFLVQRYFTASKTTREDETISPNDLMVVKQDISTFRFETYGMMQKLEEAISRTQKQNERVYQHVQLLEHAVMASKLEDNEMVKALHQQLMESTNQSDEKFRSLERQFSASHDLLLQNQVQAKRSSMGSNLFRQLGKELGERLVEKRENAATLVQQGPQITKPAEKTRKTTTIGVQTDGVGLTYTLPVAIEEDRTRNDSDDTVKGVVNEGFQDDEANTVKARITESEAKASNNLEGQDKGDAAEVQGETTSDINFEVNSSLAGESTNDALTRRHILPRQLSTESEAPSLGYSRSDKPESRRVKNIVKSIDLTEDPAAMVDEDETDVREDIREVEEGLRKSGAEWTVIPYDASKE